MHNFRKMTIWVSAMAFAKQTYSVVSRLPDSEKYGLVSQIRRCAISIPSNIAEGSSRSSNKEFAHFLKIALGSCFEIETQLLLSFDFGYISQTKSEDLLSKLIILQKSITKFLKTLE